MTNSTLRAALGAAAFTVAAVAAAQTATPSSTAAPAQPTGTTGATAFHPAGAGRSEAEANTGAANGNAGMQQAAKPGFDNKPPKGAKADCHRPQGGVDASGGENLTTASKDNTSCTGQSTKTKKR